MAQYSVSRRNHFHSGNKDVYEVTMQADQYGNIITPSAAAVSAFGEPISVPLTPVIQLDALYGLDPREFQTFSANGGFYESTGTLWKTHTGTSAGGYGVIRSNRLMRYRPGQGSLARFTAMFQSPQEGVALRAGLFSQEQSLQIGYNGTQFGILRQNGGKAHIHQFTITAGGTGTVDITLNGVTTSVAVASTDTKVVARTIASASFPGWIVEQVDSKVKFLSESVGPLAGAFTYAGTGGTATSTVLQAGVAHTENWTYQEDWNQDKLDGSGPSKMLLDPSRLNIFQVNFRWLGAGEIRWAVEDSITGNMIPIHHEHYSNRNDDVHLDNPSFRIGYVAANLTANSITDGHVAGASMMAAVEGIENDTAFTTATGVSKVSLASNGLAHGLITLKNSTIYSDKINLRKVKIKTFECSVQSNDPVQVYVILNATTKSTAYSWDSVAQYSCIVEDISAGQYNIANEHVMGQFVIPLGGASSIDLDKLEFVIPPGNTLTFAVFSGQSIQSIAAAMTWIEI